MYNNLIELNKNAGIVTSDNLVTSDIPRKYNHGLYYITKTSENCSCSLEEILNRENKLEVLNKRLRKYKEEKHELERKYEISLEFIIPSIFFVPSEIFCAISAIFDGVNLLYNPTLIAVIISQVLLVVGGYRALGGTFGANRKKVKKLTELYEKDNNEKTKLEDELKHIKSKSDYEIWSIESEIAIQDNVGLEEQRLENINFANAVPKQLDTCYSMTNTRPKTLVKRYKKRNKNED